MVLIGCIYVQSAAIYCIKKRFRIEILLHFLQYLLVICGHLWYTEGEDPEGFCSARAKGCVCSPRACRQKGSSNSVHDFRKGIQVQTKAQPVKTGVAKPDGPKRRFFLSAWQPVAKGTLLPPCRAMRAVKGVFYLEVETALHSEIIANPQTHDLCGSLRSKLYRQRHHR